MRKPIVHGTHDGYHNHHCRCDDCREANYQHYLDTNIRERQKAWRHRTGRHIPRARYLAEVEAAHGTESRYTKHRCRCEPCRRASREARARRRAKAAA